MYFFQAILREGPYILNLTDDPCKNNTDLYSVKSDFW